MAAVVYTSPRPEDTATASRPAPRTYFSSVFSEQALGEVPELAVTPEPVPTPAPAAPVPTPGPPRAPLPAAAASPPPVARPVVRDAEAPRVVRGRISDVNITFYSCLGEGFCGEMYNGQRVYQGAAACSFDLPIGTRFVIHGDPTRRVYRCDDRGLLTATWVDIYWYDPTDGWFWQSQVGRWGTIEVVEVPAN